MSDDGYENIVKIIKYFIETKRYGPVDRMAMAMGPEAVEIALYDMLRTISSLYGRSIVVRMRSEKDGKEFTVRCCEYDEDKRLGYGIYGDVVEVLEGQGDLKGKIQCMPCPRPPREDEVKGFLARVREDPSYARRLVLEAFSIRERGEGE